MPGTKTPSFSPLERLLFGIIDKKNREGSHTNPLHVHRNIRHFLERISPLFIDYLPSHGVGVDIGSGNGIFADVFGTDSLKIYNLDINPQRRQVQNFIRGDAEQIPFGDEELDIVVAFYAFHHFKDKHQALLESYRVLKPGGHLITMVEFPRYPKQELLLRLNEYSMNAIIHGEAELERPSYFSRKEFERAAKATGYDLSLLKRFSPTNQLDRVYKSQKSLYVGKKIRT